MDTTPPWFAADSVFHGSDGWYVGSADGFCVGPYPNETTARMRSLEVRKRLERSLNGGEALRIIRAFLAGDGDQSGPKNPVRAGERPRMWFRSDRCFAVDRGWYFLTREGIDVGPYDSRSEAEADVRRLSSLLRKCQTDAQKRLAIYEFINRPAITRFHR